MSSYGLYTAIKREVMRYLDAPWVTIVPPLISAVLFIVVFGVALGERVGTIAGYSYVQFMLAGVVMMTTIFNAYLNPAFGLFQSRWHGNIADFLTSPLSYAHILLAVLLAGALRGVITGTLVLVPGIIFANMPVIHIGWTLFFLIGVAFTFATLGVITGLWADNWDGASNMLTFVVTPLTYFGGVFYSLQMIEGVPLLQQLTLLNPITYMVNGVRFGLLGVAQVNVWHGVAILVVLATVLFLLCWRLFSIGWKLKE